jgi:ubiquitin carboxyl-terminal hydrolase L3
MSEHPVKPAETENPTGSRWIPLESNPDIFNFWAHKVGLIASQSRFEDVYGLDDDLLDMVPGPVKALVLLFPIDAEGEERRKREDARISTEGQPMLDKTIFWVKQTIPNACGTIGLIHALANSGATFSPVSSLQQFIIQCKDKTPLERAELLSSTPLFAEVHTESASSKLNQTAPNLDTELHFTCFVEAPEADIRWFARDRDGKDAEEDIEKEREELAQKSGTGMRLVELDGRRGGPVDHGECRDLLKDAAHVIKTQFIPGSTSPNFSVLALSMATE